MPEGRENEIAAQEIFAGELVDKLAKDLGLEGDQRFRDLMLKKFREGMGEYYAGEQVGDDVAQEGKAEVATEMAAEEEPQAEMTEAEVKEMERKVLEGWNDFGISHTERIDKLTELGFTVEKIPVDSGVRDEYDELFIASHPQLPVDRRAMIMPRLLCRPLGDNVDLQQGLPGYEYIINNQRPVDGREFIERYALQQKGDQAVVKKVVRPFYVSERSAGRYTDEHRVNGPGGLGNFAGHMGVSVKDHGELGGVVEVLDNVLAVQNRGLIEKNFAKGKKL